MSPHRFDCADSLVVDRVGCVSRPGRWSGSSCRASGAAADTSCSRPRTSDRSERRRAGSPKPRGPEPPVGRKSVVGHLHAVVAQARQVRLERGGVRAAANRPPPNWPPFGSFDRHALNAACCFAAHAGTRPPPPKKPPRGPLGRRRSAPEPPAAPRPRRGAGRRSPAGSVTPCCFRQAVKAAFRKPPPAGCGRGGASSCRALALDEPPPHAGESEGGDQPQGWGRRVFARPLAHHAKL